jgi:DNA-binding XRE family transcriptional regulator
LSQEEIAMSTLKQRMKELRPDRRKKIEARTAQLVAEEMTLRELRQARKLTQVRMAKALRISQDGVSRIEKRTDLLLSTLRKSVEAMGGSLSLIAEFPDRDPVVLAGIASVETSPSPRRPAPTSKSRSMAGSS